MYFFKSYEFNTIVCLLASHNTTLIKIIEAFVRKKDFLFLFVVDCLTRFMIILITIHFNFYDGVRKQGDEKFL